MAIDTYTSSAPVAATFITPEGHRISWGAIIAGVSLLITLSWLLSLLGAAIGVSIADATDLSAIGDGLGIGSILWLLISTLVATFAGGLLAAKMAGTADDRIGALHGLTVWSVATLLIIYMGVSGIGGAVNTISGAIGSATKMSTSVVVDSSGAKDSSALPDAITTSLAAIIKRQASSVISNVATNNNDLKQSEVRTAIEELNAEDAAVITSALIAGDTEQAHSELARRTNLSESEIDSIIEGAEQQVDSWRGSEDMQEAQQWMNTKINDLQRMVSNTMSEMAGSDVSSQELNTAIDQLDAKTLVQAGQYLVMGKPEMAKDVLAVNTNLSEEDIDAIVNGAEQDAKQLISEAKAQLNEATEAAGTYTQAALWSAFIGAILGLIAGVVGGHMGAGAVRRIYAVGI